MAKPTTNGRATTRRSFLGRLWLWLTGLAVLEGVWVVSAILKPRPKRASEDDEAIVVAGPLARFESDTVTAFPAGRFYLSRLEDGGFLALSRRCTHLGCTVPWSADEHRFVCPCHASSFDITGQVLSAPAPRPLDLVEVRVENGVVKVNVARRLRRSAFDPGQVVRA